jgi:hypothetical protein
MTQPNYIEFLLSDAIDFPRFRVATRTGYGEEWIDRRMLDRYPIANELRGGRRPDLPWFQDARHRPGCIVRHVSRVLLPAVGTAKIDVPYGEIDGVSYTLDDAEWKWLHHQIRIDAIDDFGDWKTVFWGIVQVQEDVEPPAWDENAVSTRIGNAGIRSYHCTDLTHDLARVVYDRHYYQAESGGPMALSYGAVSFNRGEGAAITPNRGQAVSEDGLVPHAGPGNYTADYWTDQDVIRLMFGIAELNGVDQPWQLDDPGTLMVGRTMLDVDDARPVRSILESVCDRSRGVGCAFMAWDPDVVGTNTTALIRVLPQLEEDIVLGPHTYFGAVEVGTAQTIILTGDHRMDDGAFRLGDSQELMADEVVTLGERIQVGVTLKVGGGLSAAWTSAAESAFDAIVATNDYERAASHEFDAVDRVLRLEDGIGRSVDRLGVRYDYRVDDNGNIQFPATDPTLATSPALLEFLPYYPCSQTADPATGTGGNGSALAGIAPLPLLIVDEYAANKYWLPNDITAQVQGPTMAFRFAGDLPLFRIGKFRFGNIRATVGVLLPHRIRRRSVRVKQPGESAIRIRRRQTIFVRDAHLWLGHPGTIIGADEADPVVIEGSVPIVYRDDRGSLNARHALASAWYLVERRQMTIGYRRTCALLPTFRDIHGERDHPQLGHLIAKAHIGGAEKTIRCIVSAIEYRDGDTKVTTDWKGLSA